MDINIINFNEFDINQISYSKSFFISQYNKKKSIGYGNNTDLFLLTPLFTNNIDFSSNNTPQYFRMDFDPMLGNILNFYNIIMSIENNIKNYILKHNKNYTLQSISRNDPNDVFIDEELLDTEINNIQNIYLKLTRNSKKEILCKVYDTNNIECSLDNLKNSWKYKGLIKIDSIWIDTIKKKFGLNIELVQLKILQPIIQIKCLIDSDILITKKNIKNNISGMELSIIDNQPQTTNKNNNNTEIALPFKPPNVMDLVKMRGALKRVLE